MQDGVLENTAATPFGFRKDSLSHASVEGEFREIHLSTAAVAMNGSFESLPEWMTLTPPRLAPAVSSLSNCCPCPKVEHHYLHIRRHRKNLFRLVGGRQFETLVTPPERTHLKPRQTGRYHGNHNNCLTRAWLGRGRVWF